MVTITRADMVAFILGKFCPGPVKLAPRLYTELPIPDLDLIWLPELWLEPSQKTDLSKLTY